MFLQKNFGDLSESSLRPIGPAFSFIMKVLLVYHDINEEVRSDSVEAPLTVKMIY